MKSHLTNEEMKAKFKSSFELVNYAIRLAENMIKTGRAPRVKSEIQNPAMLVLEEIREGKDQFDDVEEALALRQSQAQANVHELFQRIAAEDERLKRRNGSTKGNRHDAAEEDSDEESDD